MTGPCLFCVWPLPLVITCSGPPFPAAREDLGTKVEIKWGSEVSPFQKQPPLCQLPYPPLVSVGFETHSKNKANKFVSLLGFFFPSSSNSHHGTYKNRSCHKCINHLALCDSNQLGLDCTVQKVFPRFRLQREHNHRSYVLSWDRYLKRNICLSEIVSFCHNRLPHSAQRAIHLTHTHTHTQAWTQTDNKYTSEPSASRNKRNVCQFLPDALTKNCQSNISSEKLCWKN